MSKDSTQLAMLKRLNPDAFIVNELLITGYFRNHHTVLLKENNNNPFYYIHQLLTWVTLSYFSIVECFAIGPYTINLSNDQRTIRVTDRNFWRWNNTTFGSIAINPRKDRGTYRWYLQIKQMTSNVLIGIGSNFDRTGETLEEHLPPAYFFIGGSHNLRNDDIISIIFAVNGKDSSIRYCVNDKFRSMQWQIELSRFDAEYGCNYTVEYRMAVSMADMNDCVELIDFQYCQNIN